MKSNPLLKWLMIPVVLLAVLVLFKFSGKPEEKGREGVGLSREKAMALGIEGDTPRDTVATLVGEVKNLRSELKTALNDNKRQQAENERLREREGSIEQRIGKALEAERQKLGEEQEAITRERREAQGLLDELQGRLDRLGQKETEAELPVGAGSGTEEELRWLDPADAPDEQQKKSGMGFPTPFANTPEAEQDAIVPDKSSEKPVPTPFYTVPANSTLTGSVAMTALIGRIPVDGTVNDPYPFKVLIGPDNLTANGIDIPTWRARW